MAAMDFTVVEQTLQRMENATAHIVMNADGVVEAWNPPAEAVLGWTSTEACGRLLADVCIPEPLRERHTASLARWRADGTTQVLCRELRTTALHKSGALIPVAVNVQIVRQGITRFLGWVRAIDA